MSTVGGGAVRVVTLNLASGRGPRGERLTERELTAALAPLVALAPDVVSLQEVDTAQERSGHVDQAALVASVLGLQHWRSAPTLTGTPGPFRTWREVAGELQGGGTAGAGSTAGAGDAMDAGARGVEPHYGIALLSRAPVTSWHALPLAAGAARLPLRAPDPRTGRPRWWTFPDEPRVAVAAALGNGHLVAATHLSFAPVTARRQLRLVRRWLAQTAVLTGLPPGGLRLLAGDLNLPGPLLPRSVASLVRAATFPAPAPRLQLDHVLDLSATPVGGSDAGRHRAAVSSASGRSLALASGDHCALVVDVELTAPALE